MGANRPYSPTPPFRYMAAAWPDWPAAEDGGAGVSAGSGGGGAAEVGTDAMDIEPPASATVPAAFRAWWLHAEEHGLCYSFECVVPRILGDHGATPEAAYLVLTAVSSTPERCV